MLRTEETFEIREVLSAGEEKFQIWRSRLGFVIAPILFLVIYFAPLNLKAEAHKLAAVIAATFVLWVCESLPMPVTALLAATLCVILRIAPAKEVFAPFADPLMFLFIGSFIIARGIFIHGLDKRIAYSVLSLKWIDARPRRILFAFGAVTAFASAWISNTAMTAMMFAIGMSIITFVFKHEKGLNVSYATVLMLMVSFSASIGGLATPIGTPPNVIGLGFIRQLVGVEITFFKWLLIGVPLVLILYLFLFSYLSFFARAGVERLEACQVIVEEEKNKLGKWTRGQKSVLMAFLIAVFLWIFSGLVGLFAGETSELYKMMSASFPEAVGAMIGACLLFVLPGNEKGEKAMSWSEAVKIDWGVILLYGGGFTLGVLSFQTGLAKALGDTLTSFIPVNSEVGLLVASVFFAVILSELTSNTASANMIVPVTIAVAQSQNLNPLIPALGATFASSLGFMMPVSTPCNAIVYGSGLIPLTKMIKYGVLLDIFGAGLIIAFLLIASTFLM
ncbi:MAG: DASS family sodium-coupled anion symporter [Acidobacteria bacterium]|jgi:sodium-dependent dicarboxylate transporter 2/3/5|nr:MAG: DASS family sodium-coupled anion symporter [Acidobacteriota bacterium]GIU81585.1 MAG: di- and tricarboxylate transporter [Pyrinomonadaceae bacterium]